MTCGCSYIVPSFPGSCAPIFYRITATIARRAQGWARPGPSRRGAPLDPAIVASGTTLMSPKVTADDLPRHLPDARRVARAACQLRAPRRRAASYPQPPFVRLHAERSRGGDARLVRLRGAADQRDAERSFQDRFRRLDDELLAAAS